MTGKLLIIDDDESLLSSLKAVLESSGFSVQTAPSLPKGLAAAKSGNHDVILTDLQLPGSGGMEKSAGLQLIKELRATNPRTPVVLMTFFHSAEVAIQAAKLGAFDYMIKPWRDVHELVAVLRRAVENSRQTGEPVELGLPVSEDNVLIGKSHAMQSLYKEVGQLASCSIPVLIYGEPGTGKHLVAQAIHQHSDRAKQPFIIVNCAGSEEKRLVRELFRRGGRIEQAGHGTIFFNDVTELGRPSACELLELLQRKSSRPGRAEAHLTGVRVIAATHCDRREGAESFYEFYNELGAIDIHLPPLRERREDIPDLVRFFILKHAWELKRPLESVSATQEAMEFLQQQSWPGNVSALEVAIRKTLLLARGFTITLQDVQAAVGPERLPHADAVPAAVIPGRPAIPNHTLLQCVGRGGYGEVWLARNAIGTYHAVKIVRREAFQHADPFEREFRGLQKFMPISRSHPGFVHILHVGRHDPEGLLFYVMEAADDEGTGQQINPDSYSPRNLAREIRKRGHLPVAECLQLGCDLTSALEFLHQQQLIHRDIKPANIIFVNEKPKLADIGLVTDLAPASVGGTLGYMAPEGPGTAAADVYSLGKVLYEASMGLGCQLFPTLPDSMGQRADLAELRRLNKILLKACREKPTQRYQTAAELGEALLRLKAG